MNVWRFGSKYGIIGSIAGEMAKYKIAFTGEDDAQERISREVKIGDYIAITSGQKIIFVGLATKIDKMSSLGIDNTLIDMVEKDLICVKMHPFFDTSSENKFYGGQGKDFHKALDSYTRLIIDIFNKSKSEENMTETIAILKANMQIVLTGAPGTGKTYLAQEIATNLIGVAKEQLKNSNQYKFVQFHPSYDYSDFVEGLKPEFVEEKLKDESKSAEEPPTGQITFELKSGVFKKFCEDAQKAYDESPVEDNDPIKENAPKYVFVIDEINRADLSRVFGELFFGLEADYRGKPIEMQYSYLYVNRGEKKTETFSIPPNVYIIGTMNDIDRSVESMDFALRRRFAWKEITAKESEVIIDAAKISADLKEDAKKRMDQLNKKIEEIMGSASYQIGGAYFKKLEKYKESDKPFESLWSNHLEGLLKEYLRGMSKSKGNENPLLRMKNAYDLKVDSK